MSKNRNKKDRAAQVVSTCTSGWTGDLAMRSWTDDLALYNAECLRGIVHTPEWDKRMAVLQQRYNDRMAEEAQRRSEDFIFESRSKINQKTYTNPLQPEN